MPYGDFVVPCADSRHPISGVAKKQQNITKPLTCFTVGMVLVLSKFHSSVCKHTTDIICKKTPVLFHQSKGHFTRILWIINMDLSLKRVSIDYFLFAVKSSEALLSGACFCSKDNGKIKQWRTLTLELSLNATRCFSWVFVHHLHYPDQPWVAFPLVLTSGEVGYSLVDLIFLNSSCNASQKKFKVTAF